MGRYLVTGAAGFIGSAVTQRLISGGHEVVSIDNLSTGHRENIPDGTVFFEADCQDEQVYARLPRGQYDAIFHIAGQSSGEISFDNPVYDLRTNTESTLHLLKYALAVGCQRFIYASSMSVYGVKPDRPVSEDEFPLPTSFYGVGKLASENYLRLYEKYGIQPTSLRLFNVYGPGQNLENLRQGMVSIYMAQMLRNKSILVKGSETRFRDHVYIEDVVDSFVACLEAPESIGKNINIGTGVRTTVQELIELMISIYGNSVPVEISDTGTPGDLHGITADISLAKDVLGFAPKNPLKTGLKKMLDWAR